MIFSTNEEAHTRHIRQVLERLQKAQLYAKLSKCRFHVTTIDFVGFIVTPNGVAMEEDRKATITEWPAPGSHRDVQVFLGFANFYRRFIENYAKKARPLSNLLVTGKAGKFKGQFVLNEKAKAAFEKLKEAFTSALILLHRDPERPSRLETDSSDFAIGGILSQPFQYVREGMRTRARTRAAATRPRSTSAGSGQVPDQLVAKFPGDETPEEATEAVERPGEPYPEDKRAARAQGTTVAAAGNCEKAGGALGDTGGETPKKAADAFGMPREPDSKEERAVRVQGTTAAEAKTRNIQWVKTPEHFQDTWIGRGPNRIVGHE